MPKAPRTVNSPPLLLSTPAAQARTGGAIRRSLLVAPGIGYTQGTGWEFGLEALIPASRASGTNVAVVAQFLIQFDYLLPDSILGQPLFGSD